MKLQCHSCSVQLNHTSRLNVVFRYFHKTVKQTQLTLTYVGQGSDFWLFLHADYCISSFKSVPLILAASAEDVQG